MIIGLQRMTSDELRGALRVAGISPEKLVEAGPEQLRARLLSWIAETSGCPGREPAEVERHALIWMAEHSGTEVRTDEPSEAIERRIWAHVSEDAAEQLVPIWKIASSMASLGPPRALPEEIQLLDRVSERLFPSASAREMMKNEWEAFCSRPVLQARELTAGIEPELRRVAAHPELVTPTLVLSLVVALADTKYEAEEARLYEAVASGLGLSEQSAKEVQEKVSRAFWDARRELNPDLMGEQKASLIAAHRTLEQTGALRSLEAEVQTGFLANLHQAMFHDPDFQRGLKAWKGAPWMWPLGFATGVWLYLKRKLKPDQARRLAAVMYQAHAREVAPQQ